MQIHPDQLVEHFKDVLVQNHFVPVRLAVLEQQLAEAQHPAEDGHGRPLGPVPVDTPAAVREVEA
ncbi:hypothetical protein [Streptomyces sp. NPDC056707]|uniref:hypothetical protein n=1 Tax=Streptomyces sp. NPDC056707 TaxID=3345919 RepID=UPI0036AAABB2